jgi:hypothetical protein
MEKRNRGKAMVKQQQLLNSMFIKIDYTYISRLYTHPFLHQSCVPEEVGIKQRHVNEK